ncbi:MAG: peptide chain release factor-like protein [bacterium]|nr:peptide chain release factor-like protein [bacterium]
MAKIKEVYDILLLPPEELVKKCKISNYQASGPGGQKRNRKLSAVRLTHTATGLAVTASEFRETARNLAKAVHKLRLEMVLAIKPAHLAEPPTEKETTLLIPLFRANAAANHPDFPGSVLAAYVFFYLHEGGVGEASKKLGVTSSALIRFFKKDKTVWRKVQEIREHFGHYPLK